MSDTLKTLKGLLQQLELLEHIQNKLNGVRLLHESDKQTFDRMFKLAVTCICKDCRGYGRPTFGDGFCKSCNGTGNLQGLEPE